MVNYSARLMKIAQCLEYPLGLRGGVSVVVETLATEFAQRGHKIVLVSPDAPETLRELLSRKIIDQHIHWPAGDYSLTTATKLAQQLKSAGVDVAHFHAGGNYGWGIRFPFYSPVFYLHLKGVPILWTSHRAETILDGFCGPQKLLLFKLLFLPLAWLGKIQQVYCCRFEIAVSQDNLKKLKRWYAPFRSRFVQIYHSRLHDTPPPSEFASRERKILTVGHLATAKGQTVLVDAFALIAKSHQDATLLVAGHDSGDGTSQQIQKIIQAHGLEKQVCLLGQRDDTSALMRQAKIYVQPSLSEALGLALQEAMFYGCAVIGTRTGGIPELVDEGRTGALVTPGNIDELSAALDRLLRDPLLAEQWGANAANSIRQRQMTVESMADRYLELYESAATKT